MATSAPADANFCAIALPIPILPPVIKAALPFKLISMAVPPALFLDGGPLDSEQFVEGDRLMQRLLLGARAAGAEKSVALAAPDRLVAILERLMHHEQRRHRVGEQPIAELDEFRLRDSERLEAAVGRERHQRRAKPLTEMAKILGLVRDRKEHVGAGGAVSFG